ncbi:hypothetical protein [Grimontia hollisae]|uniref:Uncharacterized protein n=1 Tax=Grimontia hollisae TaxID=673 RepID=A0A377HPF1_GRIHO|nr:hypothetical protein [Grimontia hollisae]STO46050.1 Uncharacterised protein [Grimontia hollisae]STO58140.1 Uncharacterised protein [Grimontia hollisae]STQ76665.1 Uncharacterised protein [Grimontia hollisae]
MTEGTGLAMALFGARGLIAVFNQDTFEAVNGTQGFPHSGVTSVCIDDRHERNKHPT